VIAGALVLFEVLPMTTITNTTTAQIPVTTTMLKLGMKAITKSYHRITVLLTTSYTSKDYDEHNIAVVGGSISVLSRGNGGGSSNINSREEEEQQNEKSSTSTASTSSSKDSNTAKRLVHSSIRIEEEVFKSLEREAEKRGVSFNSLVNKTLKNYVTSEMYFEQLGFILVSKDFLRKTFLKFEDEKYIEEFGRELGLTVSKEYISYFFPQVNSCTLVQFLDIWFRRFQFCQHRVEDIDVVVEEKKKKQLHSFTVTHDINMNFSLVLKAILEGLVEPITKSPVLFKDIAPTSIAFSIEV
jgi:predicted HicB family RNase H-like nuclease